MENTRTSGSSPSADPRQDDAERACLRIRGLIHDSDIGEFGPRDLTDLIATIEEIVDEVCSEMLTESDWAQLMGRVLSLVDDLRAENERYARALCEIANGDYYGPAEDRALLALGGDDEEASPRPWLRPGRSSPADTKEQTDG